LENTYNGEHQIEQGDSFDFKAASEESSYKDQDPNMADKAAPEDMEPLYASIVETTSDNKQK